MNSKSSRELLCITGSEKNYALDLKWIAEIYADVHISPFPCLPPHYIGMYNYKGQIIPVISLEEADARILIIIRCNDCLFAMAVSKEPFIIDQKDVEEIDSLHPDTMVRPLGGTSLVSDGGHSGFAAGYPEQRRKNAIDE